MRFLMLREHFPCVLLIRFFLLAWFLQSVHATPFQVPSLCHLSESFPTILHWWTPLMCLFMLWGFFRILWQSLQLVHISYDGLACGPLDLNSRRSFHTTQLWWPALLWPLKSFFFLSSFPHSSHSSLVCFLWHLSCDLAVHFFARLFPTIPASDRHFNFFLRHEMLPHVFSCLMGSWNISHTYCMQVHFHWFISRMMVQRVDF